MGTDRKDIVDAECWTGGDFSLWSLQEVDLQGWAAPSAEHRQITAAL